MKPNDLLSRDVLRKTKLIVQAGPCKGMEYAASNPGNAITAKLLGQYEKEIYLCLDDITNNCNCVIDVGSAEGFYAVGLALHRNITSVFSFEADDKLRHAQSLNAERNKVVDKVSINGFCDSSALLSGIRQNEDANIALIVDIEGGEKDLLSKEVVSELRDIRLLVEVHDFIDGSISAVLIDRFANSHAIQVIAATSRTRADYPYHRIIYSQLKDFWFHCVTSDHRPPGMFWFYMTPKSSV